MHKFGLKPYRRRGKKWRKPKEKSGIYPNLLLTTMPVYPHHVWVADFTHLVWKGKIVYVATVMDVFTRRIVGLSVLTTHHAVLVVEALWNALFHNPPPLIFHSDNGSEYDAAVTRDILVGHHNLPFRAWLSVGERIPRVLLRQIQTRSRRPEPVQDVR
jgi:putative transposase